MENITIDNGIVTDRFSFDHQFGTYNDALVMSEAEYNALTSDEIEAIKTQRFNKWVDMIANPPAPVETVQE